MNFKSLTRTAKSAKGKLALTLFSALAVVGATTVLGAPKPSFTVTVAPASQTVTAGQNTSDGVTIKRQNKHTAAVALSVSGLPSNATATFTPSTIPGSGSSATLGVKTNQGGTTPPGTYTLAITGTGGGATGSTTARLVVVAAAQPNFALTATPSRSVLSSDDSAMHQVGIARSGGYTGAVALSVSGLPNQVSAQFLPSSTSGNSSILTFVSGENPKPGSYPVVVTGTGSGMTRSASITLIVEEKSAFGISGGPVDGLAPGAAVPVALSLTNPQNFPIQVTGITVSIDPASSVAGCDAAENYSVQQIPGDRYPLSIPANSTRTLTGSDRPVLMMDNSLTVNQDACKAATIYLDYSGAATK